MALAWIHAELTSLFCQQKKHVSTVTLVTEHELLSLLEVAVLCTCPFTSGGGCPVHLSCLAIGADVIQTSA